MNTTERPRAHRSARGLLLIALSLSVLLVASASAAVAEYDPTRPSSSASGTGPSGGGGSQRKVALGVAQPHGRSVAALDAHIAAVGKRPAMWAIWSAWGSSETRNFPTSMANALKARDITPTIWWEPYNPADPDASYYPRYENIKNGVHDAYIRRFARDAKAYGGVVLLRFAGEFNGSFFPWGMGKFDNDLTRFKAAWRRVHGLFQDEGATNVRFVWSIARKSCNGCNPYDEAYPGNAYVDVMGFSAYNWGDWNDKEWTSMYDSYVGTARKLREVSNKPIMVAETGSNRIGGDKAAWIRDGYREVYKRIPDIEAIVWLDADLRGMGHPDWRLSSPSSAMAAYSEIAHLSKFDTRSPFTSKRIKQARVKAGKKSLKAKKQSADRQRRRKSSAANGYGTGGSKDTRVKATGDREITKKRERQPEARDGSSGYER